MAVEVFRFLSGEVYKTPDLGFHLDQTVLKNHVVLVSVRRVLCPVHARGLKEAVPLHQGGDLRRIGAGPPCHQINVLAKAYMAVGADQPDSELCGPACC